MAEETNEAKKPVSVEESPKAETPAEDKAAPKGKGGKSFNLLGLLFKKKDGKKPAAGKGPAKATAKLIVFNPQKINLKTINQVLIGVLIALTLLLVYIATRERPQVSKVLAEISSIKLPEVESKKIESFGELSEYLDQIEQRDIFSEYQEKKPEPPPVVVKEPVKEPEPPPKPVVPIAEKAKDIKLMGISWGDNPKAMIRDMGNQSVLFIGVGEIIDGTDIKIKEIKKNEVILTSEGQEMSLL